MIPKDERLFIEAPPAPRNWRDFAACKDANPELFFPKYDYDFAAEAKKICLTCPVIRECDTFASKRPERHGIWAGRNREKW